MSTRPKLVDVTLPPLLAWVFLLAAFEGAAWGLDARVLDYDTWVKWDSGHYLSIANDGYEFMSCREVPGYDPSLWCGNAGWFPGYPLVVRAGVAMSGLPPRLVAIGVSQLCTFAALLLVWNLFLRRRQPEVLLLCAFAPGTYYFLVAFPMSMTACALLVALWAQRAGRPLVGGMAGLVAAMAYPSGVWLGGVLAAVGVTDWWRGRPARPMGWLPAAGPFAGFALVLLMHHLAVGRWNAFFLTQAKYGHTLSNPLAVLWSRVDYVRVWAREWPIGAQSLLAAALVVVAVVLVARAVRRGDDRPGEVALATCGLTYWLLPLLIGAGLSPYRAESLLLPAAIVLGRARLGLRLGLLGGGVVIWIIMAMRFIEGFLV